MVTKESVDEQLSNIGFNHYGWGRTELRELPNIILPDEKIKDCVNGIYEGGFALLVATNLRVLLVDKKPLNYLTVEDLRFDMINEIDYSHRLLGARISISTGSKNLRFTSFNQPRLRKLIGHVQHSMAETKLKQSEHQKDQNLHLEQINQQLQAYLLAQHQQQQKLQEQLRAGKPGQATIETLQPDPQLADYLFAQSLLAQHQYQGQQNGGQDGQPPTGASAVLPTAAQAPPRWEPSMRPATDDLYAEGVQEVFGKRAQAQAAQPMGQVAPRVQPNTAQQPSSLSPLSPLITPLQLTGSAIQHALDVNPLRIAYSRLPMAMRNKRFGRPSFHAHSQHGTEVEGIQSGTDTTVPAHP